MTTLLLVTAGETDLQVVIIDKNVECRTKPGKLRAFHESLLQNKDWVIDERAIECEEYSEREEIAPSDRDYLCDPEGRIRLVPAKLKPILDKVGKVDAAVVFGSWRDSSVARNEPVAIGPVLAGWIEARNKDNIAETRDLALQRREPWDPEQSNWPGGAQWVNLLREMERLGGDEQEDRPVSQKLVTRLHATLVQLRGNPKPDWVIIARTGGFPEVKQLIIPAANLIFGPERVKIMEVPRRSQQVITLGAHGQQSPVIAYHLRETAFDRVCKGDLEGAAAFAARALDDELEHHWAKAVIATANWLAGRSPVPTDAPKYLQCLNKVGLRCFLAAVRAEAALCGKRFHEAIIASVTFRDAALLDAIAKLDWVEDIDDLQKTLKLKTDPPSSLTEGTKPTLTSERDGRWSYRPDGSHAKRWIKAMGKHTQEAFGEMNGALQSGRPKIVNYRNAAVHGRLVRKDLDCAVEEFKKAGVWSGGEIPHFLHPGGPANKVLAALGASNAQALVEAVFRELEAEIQRR